MRDALQGATLSAQRLGVLARRLRELPSRPGENGVTTRLNRSLLDDMVGGGGAEVRRAARAVVHSWTRRDLRELATSWGWGQIMGWHTLAPGSATPGWRWPGSGARARPVRSRCSAPRSERRAAGGAPSRQPTPPATMLRSHRPTTARRRGARRTASARRRCARPPPSIEMPEPGAPCRTRAGAPENSADRLCRVGGIEQGHSATWQGRTSRQPHTGCPP